MFIFYADIKHAISNMWMFFSCTSSYHSTHFIFCFSSCEEHFPCFGMLLGKWFISQGYDQRVKRHICFKMPFCDLNPLCFQISNLETLVPFRFGSQQSVSSKAALCSAFMNYLPSKITFFQFISHIHIVQTSISFYRILLINSKMQFFLPV